MAVTSKYLWAGTIKVLNVAGADVGATGQQFSIRQEASSQNLVSGQSATPHGTFASEKKVFIDFSFGEFTLKNIAYAMAQAAGNLSGTTYLLLTSAEPANVAIYIEFLSSQSSEVIKLNLPICKIASGTNITFDTTQQSFMPVSFEVLADALGQLGHTQTPM